jgi:hypothetical protein
MCVPLLGLLNVLSPRMYQLLKAYRNDGGYLVRKSMILFIPNSSNRLCLSSTVASSATVRTHFVS